MSQDALPEREDCLARLTEPLCDPKVAATYARQVPYPDANPMERYFLAMNFPPGPAVRREKQGEQPLGLRDVFFSNVCAAFRRDALVAHPFDEALIMSEDQQVVRDLLLAGYAVVYQPSAEVVHSHNYTLATVYRRYFDSVYSITKIFPRHALNDSVSIGARYLVKEAGYMVRHHPSVVPRYLAYNACKMAGALASHWAERMPRAWAKKMSLHPYYWDTLCR
jgi:rhamnosyltransferase